MKAKVTGRNTRQPEDFTFDEYKVKIFEGVVDDRVYDSLHPTMKKSVDKVRKFFAEYEVELRKQGMFASQGSYQRKMKILEGQIAKFKEARATAKLNKAQRDELDELIKYSEAEFKYIKDELIPELNLEQPISPPFEIKPPMLRFPVASNIISPPWVEIVSSLVTNRICPFEAVISPLGFLLIELLVVLKVTVFPLP